MTPTADEPGTTGGVREDGEDRPEPPRKPSLWRRILWGLVAGPAWLVNKMLGGVR